MNTLKLTKKDFDKNNRYKKESLEYDGHVEIEASLGYVSFSSIAIKGYLSVLAGTGIEAGEGIEPGWGRIAVGFNIEEEQEIQGEIRKGKIILGKSEQDKKEDPDTVTLKGKIVRGKK